MDHSRKKPALFKDYKTLYRGRRLWAFENKKDEPFENSAAGCWTEGYEIIVWDISVEAAAALGNFLSDGSIEGEVTWGQGVSFTAKDIKEMIQKVVWLEKEYF